MPLTGAGASAWPLAFSLADRRAEWPEIALVAAVAFLAAYVVAALLARLLRWLLLAALGPSAQGELRPGMRRALLLVRVAAVIVVWALLAIPLLELVGLPLEIGMDRPALRHWLLASGLRIAAIAAIAWLVLRIAAVTTERLVRELTAGDDLDVLERAKRANTLGRLVHNVLAVVVSGVALMMVLRELGVDIVPMLTGAGIAGVALGFGAQWLVRDLIAGFYLNLDNHVRVGDVAAVNGVGGIVEAINLRTIVLRDFEGTVHVFQNGAINTLSNRTKDFSYYVIDLNVAYGQDPDRIAALARRVGATLLEDPAYRPSILEPLEIVGVDAFLDTKLTIRMRIKTRPLKQWEVGRELRRRLLVAAQQEGVALTPAAVPIVVQGEKV